MNWDIILRNAVEQAIGDFAVIYALAAIGLNVHFGYTGLLNFGHVAFLMLGAYGTAITVTFFGLSMWLGFGVGLLFALILALLLGVPTLRLRADYLAIVTIVAGEILRLTFRSVALREITGGSFGLTGFARSFYSVNPIPRGNYAIWVATFSERGLWFLTVGWAVVILTGLLVYLLMHSPWGRVLRSIREDEDAARSLGKNVFAYKMQSLVVGGMIGAAAGILLAVNTQNAQPDVYSPPITFFIFTALILGGAATILGPIVGGMIFWALLSLTDNVLRQAVSAGVVPSWLMSGVQVGQVRFMLVGLGLMLLMVFRPQGIFGDRRELRLDA